MARFSAYAKDRFIAPGASALTRSEIPDMSTYAKDSQHWVANFFLNSMLRASWNSRLDAYVYNYLRRAEAAFREYSSARAETIAFVESSGQSPSRYARALFHWETYLGQSWHAYLILQTAFEIEQLYSRGNASPEERLNRLYNQMKHVESRIESGQMLESATVPVWLTNEGLQSIDTGLTFVETSEVLRDIAKFADILQDPLTVREKLGLE